MTAGHPSLARTGRVWRPCPVIILSTSYALQRTLLESTNLSVQPWRTPYPLPLRERVKKSQHLMHVDHDTIGVTGGGCHEQALHQPAIFWCSGFEPRHGAQIDQRRIDGFATVEPLHEFGRPPADASVLDIDHRAIVGFNGVFRLELDRGIRPHDLEIRSKGADLPIDVPASHLAANDRNDAALADADVAGRHDAGDMGGDGEDVAGRKERLHRITP